MRSRIQRSPLTKTSVGFFIGFSAVKLSRSLSIQSTPFWSLAKTCMQMTHNQLKQSGVPFVTHMIADMARNEQNFRRLAEHWPDGRHSEFDFSNIGKYPFSCDYNQGEIRLRGLHVTNNASVYRGSNVLFVTCAGDGQLDVSLAHEMENDDQARHFVNFYIKLIEVCADSQRCQTETTLGDLLKMIET